MNETEIIDIGKEAVFTLLKIGAPVMLIALGTGLIVALFQALTSIQEMTLTFVPKIIVIFVSLLFLAPFMIATLDGFTKQLFDTIIKFG